MIAAAELIAFLLVLKYSITGAVLWLRHGTDGVEFICSKQFPRALLHFRGEKQSDREIEESKRLDMGEIRHGN